MEDVDDSKIWALVPINVEGQESAMSPASPKPFVLHGWIHIPFPVGAESALPASIPSII